MGESLYLLNKDVEVMPFTGNIKGVLTEKEAGTRLVN
jgi:hypothetical protein